MSYTCKKENLYEFIICNEHNYYSTIVTICLGTERSTIFDEEISKHIKPGNVILFNKNKIISMTEAQFLKEYQIL